MNTFECEVIYDLTWNMARESDEFIESFSDSRERFNIITEWAKEFNSLYREADWNKLDYLETIDAFYDEKVQELKEAVRGEKNG